ncbi:hypothetical protein RSAG8_03908, partial [Rhizoctonia solani AG-8 WAC10335]
MLFSAVFLTLSATLAFASPLEPRAAPDNTVLIASSSTYCMIMPPRTNNSQGKLPDKFWKKVTYKKGKGKGDWVQLTGCINKGFSQLNDNDGGGQYDSSGGAGAANPRGSKCQNYKHYVEIVEPDVGRACIRCCQEYSDCPLDKDTAGCPAVVPGTYC